MIAENEIYKLFRLTFIANVIMSKKSGYILLLNNFLWLYPKERDSWIKRLGHIIDSLFLIFDFSELVDSTLKGGHRRSWGKIWEHVGPRYRVFHTDSIASSTQY